MCDHHEDGKDTEPQDQKLIDHFGKLFFVDYHLSTDLSSLGSSLCLQQILQDQRQLGLEKDKTCQIGALADMAQKHRWLQKQH